MPNNDGRGGRASPRGAVAARRKGGGSRQGRQVARSSRRRGQDTGATAWGGGRAGNGTGRGLLVPDLEHLGPAGGAHATGRGPAVLHHLLARVLHRALLLALHAVGFQRSPPYHRTARLARRGRPRSPAVPNGPLYERPPPGRQ